MQINKNENKLKNIGSLHFTKSNIGLYIKEAD